MKRRLETMEQVLPPWTPVMAQTTEQGVDVNIWGRTYQLANAPLPTSIITAREEILASPIRLVGTVDGKPAAWQRKGILLFRQDEAQATLLGWQTSESLIINTILKVEFDGMMRVDMVVMPQRAALPQLERLWLEVPLKPERATLFHYWPGRWGSAENSGTIPDSGLALPFKPFVWLGWEEGGLSWFAESDKGWQPKEESRYIEVVRQGEEVLRLHLLDSMPPRLPLTFTFGFQATPVKPIPKEFHEWRICHGATYGIEKHEMKLERIAELGVKTLVFHEDWTPIQNYWETNREAELKQLVSECHRHGIRILLYFGYELSTLAPEWGELADEVLLRNPQEGLAGGYYRHPEQRDYVVCYNSRWQDRLVEGVAQALERYGFDGVYLDGTIEPLGCANEQHGCGYRSPDGSLHATYPIFAVRRLMKRLYALIHPKGGLINAHQSTCCLTPTLSFCHSYWDGEQFGGGELAGDPIQRLPLAAFRAEFMGKNFGVPSEFLVYERPPGWTFEHALAFTLLHDVRVRPGGFGKQLELMAKIWGAMSSFGAGEAEWYPYWRNQQFVETYPETVKVSFYLRRGTSGQKSRALLVVSNLSAQQDVKGQVILNLRALEPSRMFTSACDAITGERFVLEDNRLQVLLQPMRARLVLVE
ncbi:MAG: glycoside hydrolase domain-containing protein [Thermoproteota archaeon]